jgi:hypothetical protein
MGEIGADSCEAMQATHSDFWKVLTLTIIGQTRACQGLVRARRLLSRLGRRDGFLPIPE